MWEHGGAGGCYGDMGGLRGGLGGVMGTWGGCGEGWGVLWEHGGAAGRAGGCYGDMGGGIGGLGALPLPCCSPPSPFSSRIRPPAPCRCQHPFRSPGPTDLGGSQPHGFRGPSPTDSGVPTPQILMVKRRGAAFIPPWWVPQHSPSRGLSPWLCPPVCPLPKLPGDKTAGGGGPRPPQNQPPTPGGGQDALAAAVFAQGIGCGADVHPAAPTGPRGRRHRGRVPPPRSLLMSAPGPGGCGGTPRAPCLRQRVFAPPPGGLQGGGYKAEGAFGAASCTMASAWLCLILAGSGLILRGSGERGLRPAPRQEETELVGGRGEQGWGSRSAPFGGCFYRCPGFWGAGGPRCRLLSCFGVWVLWGGRFWVHLNSSVRGGCWGINIFSGTWGFAALCWFSLGSGGVGATPGGVFWGCDGAVLQVEALQEVLEKLRGRELPAAKKKLGRVPSCLPREPCAVRMGARFGTRCSCPPGTACNLHVLKCS
uniref:Cocaine- and amphetamine-regulated transcript protein n=1 Tax=Cairina moschata TaxID=8855 RepID=A0A8C3CA54_CAIMO